MRRHEAIGLLKEISEAFRETISVDAINLSLEKNFLEGELSFRVCLHTTSDLRDYDLLKPILKKYGAYITKSDNCIIIYKPNYTNSA